MTRRKQGSTFQNKTGSRAAKLNKIRKKHCSPLQRRFCFHCCKLISWFVRQQPSFMEPGAGERWIVAEADADDGADPGGFFFFNFL